MSQTKDINLIPFDVIMKEKSESRIWMWAVLILLLAAVLVGVYLFEKRQLGKAEEVVADLSVKQLEIEDKIQQLKVLQEKRDRLSKKEGVITALLHKRSLSLLFSELEKSMNNNVWLISFNFKDTVSSIKRSSQDEKNDKWVKTGSFIMRKNTSETEEDSQNEGLRVSTVLQGVAKSNKDLAGFLEKLSKSRLFSEVNLRYSRDGGYEGLNMVEFEIETYLDKV